MKIVDKFWNYYKDPLYRNSFYIMLTSMSSSAFGFLFWLIAAQNYSAEAVGVAIAIISSINLIVLLSRFGLDQSLIRFFPDRDKSKVFSSALLITTLSTSVLGLIYLFTVEFWSPDLTSIREYALFYLLFLVVSSIISVVGISFVALRKSEHYFIQSILIGLKVVFLFPLVFLGSFGIFSSFGISATLAILVSFLFLYRYKIRFKKIDFEFLRVSMRFSVGNYFAGVFVTIPNMALPIMVLNMLGAISSAQYYIVYAIFNLLFMVSYATSTSLFVEGSHGNSITKSTVKAISVTFLILIPAVVILYFFGDVFLGLIGESYVSAFPLLRVMVLSSFFVALCQIFFSIKKIQKNMKELLVISLIIFILLFGLSYQFMLQYGIIGVGYAWVISYGVCSILIIIFLKKLKLKA